MTAVVGNGVALQKKTKRILKAQLPMVLFPVSDQGARSFDSILSG